MTLIVHAVLGIIVVALIVRSNPVVFRRPASGPGFSPLEIVYYAIGVASIPLCWYFNYRYVAEYGADSTNPIVGPGSWAEFISLGYANPAASSASADYTIANVLLLPLFTIFDGRRRGIRKPWLFFICSLFTSFAFAWAFYLATVERQRLQEKSLQSRSR